MLHVVLFMFPASSLWFSPAFKCVLRLRSSAKLRVSPTRESEAYGAKNLGTTSMNEVAASAGRRYGFTCVVLYRSSGEV